MEENKEKALQSAISQIEKDHGKGALMKLGDGSAYLGQATIIKRQLRQTPLHARIPA